VATIHQRYKTDSIGRTVAQEFSVYVHRCMSTVAVVSDDNVTYFRFCGRRLSIMGYMTNGSWLIGRILRVNQQRAYDCLIHLFIHSFIHSFVSVLKQNLDLDRMALTVKGYSFVFDSVRLPVYEHRVCSRSAFSLLHFCEKICTFD